MPQTLSESIIIEIRRLWGVNPQISGVILHSQVERRFGRGSVSLRRVQQIIAELRSKPDSGRFIPQNWYPWDDTPEETFALLKLQAFTRSFEGRLLREHEAMWGNRLRPYGERYSYELLYILVGLYATQQAIAENTLTPPYTFDLDAILEYEPWDSVEKWTRYFVDVRESRIEEPMVLADAHWRQEGDRSAREEDNRSRTAPVTVPVSGIDGLLVELARASNQLQPIYFPASLNALEGKAAILEKQNLSLRVKSPLERIDIEFLLRILFGQKVDLTTALQEMRPERNER